MILTMAILITISIKLTIAIPSAITTDMVVIVLRCSCLGVRRVQDGSGNGNGDS